MGVFDNFKAFIHSITTEDHYASYGSPYKNSTVNQSGNLVGGTNSSSSRLNEISRLATLNSSSNSLIENNGGPVGYRPGLRSSNTNLHSSSDVQLATFDQGQPPLPSIESLWNRIEAWLEEEYPELEDNLNDGVTTADLNEFENDLGLGSLPVEFRQFYKIHDGQFRGGKPTGLIMGLILLDIESIVEEYSIWAKVCQRLEKQQLLLQRQAQLIKTEGSSSIQQQQQEINQNNFILNQKSIPPNAVQPYYVHKGWIPIIKDLCGNQFAVDLAPGPQGKWGQIILFGRDFDTKVVVASNLQQFLFEFINDLEQGKFQIDQSQINVDNGFLDNSRDDDYMIGDEDEGEGELTFYDVDGKEFGAKLKGKLNYIDVWKRRALKKYGISDVESFQTSFIPKKLSAKKKVEEKGLINLESQVTLPKETIIDEEDEGAEAGAALVDETDKKLADEEGSEITQVATEMSAETDTTKADAKPDATKLDTTPDTKLDTKEDSTDTKHDTKQDSAEN